MKVTFYCSAVFQPEREKEREKERNIKSLSDLAKINHYKSMCVKKLQYIYIYVISFPCKNNTLYCIQKNGVTHLKHVIQCYFYMEN